MVLERPLPGYIDIRTDLRLKAWRYNLKVDALLDERRVITATMRHEAARKARKITLSFSKHGATEASPWALFDDLKPGATTAHSEGLVSAFD